MTDPDAMWMMSVGAWHARWLDVFPREAAETWRRLMSGSRPFVELHGDRPLDSITKLDALEFAAAHPGHARWVRSMFQDAVKAGLIETCPFEGVPVKINRGSGPRVVLDEADIAHLADAAESYYGTMPGYGASYGAHIALAIRVSAYAGLRIGELCRLRRKDVTLADRELQVAPFKGRPERVAVYPEWMGQDIHDEIDRGGGVFGPGPLFIDPYCEPLTPARLRRLWRPVRERAGLDACRWHDLRHHAVTWLLERADPIAVAFQIHGHANPATVLSLYNSPSPKRARERLRRLI